MAYFRALALGVLVLAAGGCASSDKPVASPAPAPTVQFVEAPGPISCPSGGTQMTSVTLFFGMAIPGGGKVTDGDWRSFLDTEVTPRFPEGLSVLEAAGQWKDADTGKVVRENSRALLIWVAPSSGASAEIDAIRDAYKIRFRPDSVMRVDDTDCVDF